MKVGDLIQRKDPLAPYFHDKRENGTLGFVVALGHGGNPVRPVASILYPLSGNRYEIARSLLEVVNESR